MSSFDKYRVHEVAKDFGLPSKTITEILTKYATTPKNHMQVLEDGELSVIFDYLTQHNQCESMEDLFKIPAKPEQPKAAEKSAEKGAEPAKPAPQQPAKPQQPQAQQSAQAKPTQGAQQHAQQSKAAVKEQAEALQARLEAGEDPLYVARRLVRFASEDIGLADSRALEITVAAYQACHFLGMPECCVHLTHAVVYLSLAPRSNALYLAYERAKEDALKMLDEPVPLVIRNAPTRLMKELDYGKGYVYAHDTEEKLADMDCLPESLLGRRYYEPTDQGSEARAKENLTRILARRAELRAARKGSE